MELSSPPVKPILSGHEKFPLRHGWLKKGVDAATANPQIFNQDEALVVLGVGKNMVRSIRHWCLAAGLLAEDTGKGGGVRPTPLATRLLAVDGWDPFLEDVGSLWLLHWQLVANPARGAVWRAVFGSYYEPEFNKAQLRTHVSRFLDKLGAGARPATIEQNVDVCLRTYVPAQRTRTAHIAEDSFDSPLVDLDLLRYVAEDDVYRFNIGPKSTLNPAVFAYALCAFAPDILQRRRTLNVEECLYRPVSPGQVFKLDENSVIELLEQIEVLTAGKLRLQEGAGLRQISFTFQTPDELTPLAYRLLDDAYAHHTP